MFSEVVVPPGFEPGSWHPECHMMDRYTKGLTWYGLGPDISRKPSNPVFSTHDLKPEFTFSRLSGLGRSRSSVSSTRGVSDRPRVSVAVGTLSS